ncbi:hypothetical protein ACKLNR_007565 [Fusarium oxysporum f. sp. zingiberi]
MLVPQGLFDIALTLFVFEKVSVFRLVLVADALLPHAGDCGEVIRSSSRSAVSCMHEIEKLSGQISVSNVV